MARITRSRESSPPISGMATTCSGSGGIATTVSLVDACHLRHDQEPRVAMWEVTADADARHFIDSRRLFDAERLRDALGLHFQAGPQMHLAAPGHGDASTCHPSLVTSATARDRSSHGASCPAIGVVRVRNIMANAIRPLSPGQRCPTPASSPTSLHGDWRSCRPHRY